TRAIMNAAIVALIAAVAGSAADAPLPPVTDTVDTPASQAGPEPTILDMAADDVTQPDGRRARWMSVTYALPSGHEAEVFIEVDERGRGDGLIYVDGEALVHVTTDEQGDITTWTAPNAELSREAIIDLAGADLAND